MAKSKQKIAEPLLTSKGHQRRQKPKTGDGMNLRPRSS